MFKLTLDRFSSDLASQCPFLNDILERALIILNHNRFQHDVLNELCSKVVKNRSKDCEELGQFVENACSQLKMQVCVDKLDIPDVLMQCEVFNYDENKPCTIYVSQSWYKHVLEISPDGEEYQCHVVLGVIKLIHEVCHCSTSVFCTFSSLVNSEKKPIKITPPNIGRKIVKRSPNMKASPLKRKRGTLKINRTKKSTKEIGDMGFGGEELLLGGRLFPIIENSSENKFKIIGLRIDEHHQSSIASKKFVLDHNFISQIFNLDQLRNIDHFDHFKIQCHHPFDINQGKEQLSFHTPTLRSKRKLKRADSDLSSLSSTSVSSNSTDSSNLFNVDPNDPNVLYPPYYIPPPDFVPRSPNSIISTDEDDAGVDSYRINGMPSNFRE